MADGRINPWRTGCLSLCVHFDSTVDNFCCYPCATSRLCLLAKDSTLKQEFSILHCVCAAPLLHFYAFNIRNVLAARYKIEEGIIGTCVVACLCPWCSNAQVHREASLSGEWPGGSCMDKAPIDPASIH